MSMHVFSLFFYLSNNIPIKAPDKISALVWPEASTPAHDATLLPSLLSAFEPRKLCCSQEHYETGKSCRLQKEHQSATFKKSETWRHRKIEP